MRGLGFGLYHSCRNRGVLDVHLFLVAVVWVALVWIG